MNVMEDEASAVKQNEGFIDVFSETDQGTVFTIYLPRYCGKPADRAWETASELRGKTQGAAYQTFVHVRLHG